MKFLLTSASLAVMMGVTTVDAQGEMVKMCLFYPNPSGHARSDPIINQQCASDHVHTFYGPQEFHPDTTYNDLLNTPPQFSSSPFVENNSLYWHPSFYQVVNNGDGTETFHRVNNIETSPYYRWDNSVAYTEAFPPEFRMIAASTDSGADVGGEVGGNLFTECCDLVNDEEQCESWDGLEFPTRTCDFLGVAFAMPTCWNGDLGINNDHKDHMAYTLDGSVAGSCPNTHPRRLPQIQLFIRIIDYQGGKYQLSDGQTSYHVDFFNGWQEGKLQEILDGCPIPPQQVGEYNPECGCTEDGFLTENLNTAGTVCDEDVRRLILDEATDVTTSLPRTTCAGGPPLQAKSWNGVTDDLFAKTCESGTNPAPTLSPAPTPEPTPECFSPSVTTIVEGKGLVAMKDLRVGDKVMTASSGDFQTVYDMDHYHTSKPTEFLQIHTTMTQQNPLELTPLHMIFVEGKSNPVPATLLKVGDYVQTKRMVDTKSNDDDDGKGIEFHQVTKIERVVRNGFYNALTADGTIVVDGVVSSTYPALSGTEYVEVGGIQVVSHHDLVHTTLIPIRTFFHIRSCISSCVPFLGMRRSNEEEEKAKTDKEYFAWYSQAHSLFFHQWHQGEGWWFLMVAVVFSFLVGLAALFSAHLPYIACLAMSSFQPPFLARGGEVQCSLEGPLHGMYKRQSIEDVSSSD